MRAAKLSAIALAIPRRDSKAPFSGYTENQQNRSGKGIRRLKCNPDLNNAWIGFKNQLSGGSVPFREQGCFGRMLLSVPNAET